MAFPFLLFLLKQELKYQSLVIDDLELLILCNGVLGLQASTTTPSLRSAGLNLGTLAC